jgi:hypothetical protein
MTDTDNSKTHKVTSGAVRHEEPSGEVRSVPTCPVNAVRWRPAAKPAKPGWMRERDWIRDNGY